MVSSVSFLHWLWMAWGLVEAIFYAVFHLYLRPRANQRTVPAPYRSPYASNRRLLVERIVQRILRDAGYPVAIASSHQEKQEHQAETEADAEREQRERAQLEREQHTVLANFLLAWFRTTKTNEDTILCAEEEQQEHSVLTSTSTSSIEATTRRTTPINSSSPSSRLFSSSSSSGGQVPSRLPSSTCYSDDEEMADDTASDDSGEELPIGVGGGMVVSSPSLLASSDATITCSPVTSIVQRCIETTTDGTTTTTTWRVPGMTTLQMRRFLAWAFFAADETDLQDNADDMRQLQDCMDYLRYELHVSGDDESPPHYFPRRMTLEDVCPWHRPLLVYVIVQLLRWVAGIILRGVGFQFVQSTSGVRGWVRVTTNDNSATTTTPLVFFHGIAPAAILLYLPMVLWGMQAPKVLLIENPNISCCIQFTALSENDTVDGVQELVERHFGNNAHVVLAGHSFGSCPITWILNHLKENNDDNDDNSDNSTDNQKQRMIVRDVLLLDPVTILLSESDVMINFLYSHEKVFDKIRMVASSELFTEYYLRRHFAWYNSELWLEDFTTTTNFFVGLAQEDEIVNAQKVHHHIMNSNTPNVQVKVWEKVGHGSVVTDANKWHLLRQRLAQSNVVVAE